MGRYNLRVVLALSMVFLYKNDLCIIMREEEGEVFYFRRDVAHSAYPYKTPSDQKKALSLFR